MNESSALSPLQRFLQSYRGKGSWKRILLTLVAGVLLIEWIGLVVIWPDWDALRQGQVPQSALMQDYLEAREKNPKLPRLQWMPLRKSLPDRVKRAFILAEDSRFYEHYGVDWQAIANAIDYNWRNGKVVLGASTISQQTAKNMFLSLSRNPLRKFHELFLTWLLEFKLSKSEILHIYLNIAEFGTGIYGIEAASRHYFHSSAYQLTSLQAAQLAASLPSPKKHNPATRTRFFNKHVSRLARTLQIADQYAAQRGQKPNAEAPMVSAELAKKLQELRELNSEDTETAHDSATDAEASDAEATTTETETAAAAVPEAPAAAPASGTVTAGEATIEKTGTDAPTATPVPVSAATSTPSPTPTEAPVTEPAPPPLLRE